MMLLAVVSSSALAEWIKVSEDKQGSPIYVNPTFSIRNGNIVDMSDLTDFNSAQTFNGAIYLSLKSQSQYDCKEELTREISETGYSGNMGNGKSVFNFDVREWHPVSPHNSSEILWKLACGKR